MTAVAYFLYNRPELTKITFDRIRDQRPERLFLVADGPRPEVPGDRERCQQARLEVENIDWPCDVQRNYASENLGARRRISSGLDAVFAEVEKAIVLEDDCLPHPYFFRFCGELLDRYEDDERVFTISGDNFQFGRARGSASYYFSQYPNTWGWASWRRAWANYDVDIKMWPSWRDSVEWRRLLPRRERMYWEDILEQVRQGSIDTWDYQWLACSMYMGGLTAVPNANLVTNIGFGAEATHTKDPKDRAVVPVSSLGDVVHPTTVEVDLAADRFTFRNHFRRGILRRGVNRIRGLVGRNEAVQKPYI